MNKSLTMTLGFLPFCKNSFIQLVSHTGLVPPSVMYGLEYFKWLRLNSQNDFGEGMTLCRNFVACCHMFSSHSMLAQMIMKIKLNIKYGQYLDGLNECVFIQKNIDCDNEFVLQWKPNIINALKQQYLHQYQYQSSPTTQIKHKSLPKEL